MLMAFDTSSTAAPAKKQGYSDQEAEVIPASIIGVGIDSPVGKKAADKTEQDDKSMQETFQKTGKDRRGFITLGCTGCQCHYAGQYQEK